jgi:hypothetical protein
MMRWRWVLSLLLGALIFLAFGSEGHGLGALVSSLLMAGVVVLGMTRSKASGLELVLALSGLVFVVTWLVNIPEGVLFDVIAPADAPVILLMLLVVTVVAVTSMAAVAGRLGPVPTGPPEAPARSGGRVAWRLVALPAVFVLCYFAAGLLIYSYVEPYYAGRTMPGPAAIASMQVLRALALLGAAYPLLRTLETRRDAILVVAIAVPVLGAVAPLLPANEAMPASIRLVHGLEMAPYYALYGWLVAVWFGPLRRGSKVRIPTPGAVHA